MTTRTRKDAMRGLVVIAASILIIAGLAPSPAQAEPAAENDWTHAWTWWKDPAKTANGGVGEIRSYGENIVLEDFYSDGWGTRGQLQIRKLDPAGYYYFEDFGGVCFDDTNTSNTAGGRTICNRNVPEGTTFRIHVWASKSGTYKWHSYSPYIVA